MAVDDLYTNGAEFIVTVARPHNPFENRFVLAEAFIMGDRNRFTVLRSVCGINRANIDEGQYNCTFSPPLVQLEKVRTIMLRYSPSLDVWCLLGITVVMYPEERAAMPSSVSSVVYNGLYGISSSDIDSKELVVGGVSSTPECIVMTNGLIDGSVFVLLASCPCAPHNREGTKIAMYVIAPFSVVGSTAALFGNIYLAAFLWLVGFATLYVGKTNGWKLINELMVVDNGGFRATLFGMWFWLSELTYPGVVVGTFGLIREGGGINIGLGVVGCVYLVVIPVMAVVVASMGSPLVTYVEINNMGPVVTSRYEKACLEFVPVGLWGGTGPAFGPVTEPFAGIRKAVLCAPLTYIVMAVIGAILHGMGPETSCMVRLITVAVLLSLIGVAVAVTRPFRYPINNLLYVITFELLAVHAAILAITASRHNVRGHNHEDDSDHVLGFAQLAIGVLLCLVFLVRGVVFVVILINEGANARMKTIILMMNYR